ncbi:hypothetical protein D3C87_1970250 [compost metagenome]
MADGRDRLVSLEEMLHGGKHIRIQPQIFRRATTRNDQRVVIRDLDIGKSCVEREIMAAFF